jgi:RNA polymerase sigma-70 factor (ECF subfamily)
LHKFSTHAKQRQRRLERQRYYGGALIRVRSDISTTRCPPRPGPSQRRIPLATRKELSDFLAAVERRAFKQAYFAARDEQVALDAVQDAMMKLSEKYSARPIAELPMLFQRILQNTIRDHFRRQKVRTLWTTQVSSLAGADGDDDHDPLETLEVQSNSNPQGAPSDQLQQAQTLEIIEKALQKLPHRQRQAFLLRYWEEMDVAEAAAAMGCSQGSVKTHCSRATHALAELLKDKGISL